MIVKAEEEIIMKREFYFLLRRCVHVTSTPFGSYCLLPARCCMSRISFLTLTEL
jgi:hypothetical protein